MKSLFTRPLEICILYGFKWGIDGIIIVDPTTDNLVLSRFGQVYCYVNVLKFACCSDLITLIRLIF